jgi:DNA replication and repair protein RecF
MYMFLDSIEANNFRNLKGRILWGRGLNILYGNNGQGKTNWLEAIYVLSRTKSFRTQRLQEAIRFGEDSAFIRGQVTTGANIQRDLQVYLQGKAKSNTVNDKREHLTRYISQLQVFAFTAAELEVVRGMPESRRRFIDRGVASIKPTYVQTLSDYGKVLKQKNRILQDASDRQAAAEETLDLLRPWNEQLVKLGAQIHNWRVDYVDQLNQALERQLFEQEDVTIRYVSALEGKGDLRDYESVFSERLGLRFQAELAAGHALLGPQRDNLEILFGGREIRIFGSAGQQRSALLLLDLAAISLYNSGHYDYPLFLIDDVDAELDEKRIKQLLEYLEGRTQTFITTSKRSHVAEFLSKANVYKISEGAVVAGEQEYDSSVAIISASAEGV